MKIERGGANRSRAASNAGRDRGGGRLARGAVRVGRTVGEVLEALVLNLELERVHEELGVILRARWAAVGGDGTPRSARCAKGREGPD